MRDRHKESGQALIFVALSMAVLMGFMALAIDVGLLFRARRNMQIAADAAAAAAALNYLYYGSVGTAKTAAINAAAANGVTIIDSDINTPPLSGPNSGTTAGAYFEVIPHQPQGTTFMGVISHSGSVNVAARAVAGTPAASKACIWIGNPTGNDTFHLQGNTTVTAAGCGIYVNSSAAGGLKVTGGSTSVTAAYFDVVGNYSGKSTPPTNPVPNSPPQSNPLGSIPGPNPATDCTGSNTVTAATVTSSTSISSANGITCFSAANVNLSAGITLPGGVIYVFENGVNIGGTMTLGSSTSGVTLDIYSGTFNQGNSNLSIFAPTSGTYNGIAIMQPASNATTLQVQFGSGNETLDGMIYAPGAEVYLQDNGGGVTATGVIADTMYIKSSSLTIPSYSAAHPTTTPLRAVTLVE
jgi:Flp pilus assembly protein TadG